MFTRVVFLIPLIIAQNVVYSASGFQQELAGDIAKKMCKAYAKYAQDPSLSSCAFVKDNLNSTVEHSSLASRKEFPHMVSLVYETINNTNISYCGGSLISDRFILTAAQCTKDFYGQGLLKFVKAGITNVNDKSNLQVRNVESIIVHPDYYQSISRYYDIALLKVDRPFDLNPFVRPACLHTEGTIPYQNGLATGWGKTSFLGEPSEDLKKIKLEIFDSAKCNKIYAREIKNPDSTLPKGFSDHLLICAGSSDDVRNTCQGDAGGPLQIYHEDTDDIKCMYSVVGIVSFGKVCKIAKDVPEGITKDIVILEFINCGCNPRELQFDILREKDSPLFVLQCSQCPHGIIGLSFCEHFSVKKMQLKSS